MAQIILFIIAIIAFVKKSIPVTKDTEITHPKTYILGVYALLGALIAGSIPKLYFYLILIVFFILVGIFNKPKETKIK